MASSVTRSSRRAEGVHSHYPQLGRGDGILEGGGHGRHKRALDATERDLRPKKTRFAVDVSKPLPTSQIHDAALGPGLSKPNHHPQPKPDSSVDGGMPFQVHRGRRQPSPPPPSRSVATSREQGRKLRSQEATRFKSDLSAYFADYDEVIGNDPKEHYLLNIDTPIVVHDTQTSSGQLLASTLTTAIRGYGDSLYTDVFDAQRVDFGFLETQHIILNVQDSLPDVIFEPSHRRAERLERSIRNTEKGRAQHEKDQIIRLLHGLQGHDWLRVMGVSGITETRKKKFEPAREYFIRGCQNILNKFRNWSEQEKRHKQEKDRSLAELAADYKRTHDTYNAMESQLDRRQGTERPTGPDIEWDEESDSLHRDEYNSSEASSPAQQLGHEAMVRSRIVSKRSRAAARLLPVELSSPSCPAREFRTFFSKRYERDNALNKQRRSGRKVLAWGLPLPDLVEADFTLPEEYRDDETLRLRERRKRRDKRSKRL